MSPLPAVKSRSFKLLQLLLQVAFLCLLAWFTHTIAAYLGSPIPGAVLGMTLLLILLSFKVVPEKAVNLGASWLIADLLLFFIPSVVAVLKYEPLFEQYGLNIIAVVILGSSMVLLGTGFVVDKIFRFERRLNHRRRQLILATR